MSRDMMSKPYEAPALAVLGTFHADTQSQGMPCFWGKSIGDPDYTFHIPVPITNCS